MSTQPIEDNPVRRVCEMCRQASDVGDICCIACGWDLGVPPIRWSNEINYAAPLNWIAQSYRRLLCPLDSSERGQWPAFDYAWRAFNYLYSEKVPGSRGDKKRMKEAIAGLDQDALLVHLQRAAIPLPGTFRPGIEAAAVTEIESQALPQITELRSLYTRLAESRNGAPPPAITEIAEAIYTARNTRIHGEERASSIVTIRNPTDKLLIDIDAIEWMIRTLIAIDKFFLLQFSGSPRH